MYQRCDCSHLICTHCQVSVIFENGVWECACESRNDGAMDAGTLREPACWIKGPQETIEIILVDKRTGDPI